MFVTKAGMSSDFATVPWQLRTTANFEGGVDGSLLIWRELVTSRVCFGYDKRANGFKHRYALGKRATNGGPGRRDHAALGHDRLRSQRQARSGSLPGSQPRGERSRREFVQQTTGERQSSRLRASVERHGLDLGSVGGRSGERLPTDGRRPGDPPSPNATVEGSRRCSGRCLRARRADHRCDLAPGDPPLDHGGAPRMPGQRQRDGPLQRRVQHAERCRVRGELSGSRERPRELPSGASERARGSGTRDGGQARRHVASQPPVPDQRAAVDRPAAGQRRQDGGPGRSQSPEGRR